MQTSLRPFLRYLQVPTIRGQAVHESHKTVIRCRRATREPEEEEMHSYTRRVSTKRLPRMKAYYNQHVVYITLESGARLALFVHPQLAALE